jgi:hypothetical protein
VRRPLGHRCSRRRARHDSLAPPPALGRSREVGAENKRDSKPRPPGPRPRAPGPGPATSDHWRRSKPWTRPIRRLPGVYARAQPRLSAHKRRYRDTATSRTFVCLRRRVAPLFAAPCRLIIVSSVPYCRRQQSPGRRSNGPRFGAPAAWWRASTRAAIFAAACARASRIWTAAAGRVTAPGRPARSPCAPHCRRARSEATRRP